MNKGELERELLMGKALNEILPECEGQGCLIYKADSWHEKGNDILYIPDFFMNELPYNDRWLNNAQIRHIISECYTRYDFLREAYNKENVAKALFAFVDWQHLNIQDLKDTDEDEAEELYGETFEQMETEYKKGVKK